MSAEPILSSSIAVTIGLRLADGDPPNEASSRRSGAVAASPRRTGICPVLAKTHQECS